MKIFFIVPYPTSGPSNRFRVEQYLPYLDKKNVTYRVRPFCNNEFYFLLRKRGHYFKKFAYLLAFSFRRLVDLFRSLNYDVVFIHREAFPTKDYIFEWLFRRFAKRMIYDFDDSVFLKKPAKVAAAVRMADRVIAGNDFLKNYASSLNKDVVILPTCIDTMRYKPAANKNDNQKVVIGWIGSPTTSEYLKALKDVFKAISDKYKNVEIRIIGGMSGKFLGPSLIYKNWSLEREIDDLQEFDIGIMPMPDNEWTRGKCAFKIIQYMASGIPSVASPVGMNLEVIKDGVSGFFASGTEEWREKLSKLIESPELRKELGGNGRKTVEVKYSLNANEDKFLGLLEKKEKIKIARIITRLNIGGPAIHTILLTKGINKDVFETYFVAGRPDASEGDMAALAAQMGVSVEYIPEMAREISFRDFPAFVRILKLLLKIRPSIIHTHTAKAGTLGRLAAIIAGVPVKIHTFHGHIFDGYFSPIKTKVFLIIEKFLAIFTDKIIVVSEGVRDEIVDKLKVVPREKCVVLKLGFELESFLNNDRSKGALRKEFNIPPDMLLIGIVGRLVPIKNHRMFLEVARRVINNMPGRKLKFFIIGDGELKKHLEEEAKATGLENDVIFTGWVREIAKVYADLDVVVLTSLNEGTPVSLIEAMASARPVVATSVGGVADIVTDGKNGFLFGQGDVEGFAGGVAVLLNDGKRSEELGLAGREFVRNNFYKDRLIRETEDLYYECLERKRKKI